MTFAMKPKESCTHDVSEGPVSPTTAQNSVLPRFNLQKRSVNSGRSKMNLHSVNSAFLSGLFADVAKVQGDIVSENPPQDLTAQEPADPRLDQTLPFKKTRVSMTKSMSYYGKSMMNLRDALVKELLSTDMTDAPSTTSPLVTAPDSPSLERKDSLLYQLSCVSSSRSNGSSIKANFEATLIAFPHLPATVSASSCNTLTRNLSDLQSFTTEKPQKESYGWFVEMDEEETPLVKDPYATTTKSAELAFQAPTAPKATNDDAEVEWAKAADTVDDVLGDFF